MKIVCIDNKNCAFNLTIDKIYNTYDDDLCNYYMYNDGGHFHYYPKEWFKPLSEVRNEKIDKLLEE